MPVILIEEDLPMRLGETDAPLVDVKAVFRTFEDGGTWTMTEQGPSKKHRPTEFAARVVLRDDA